MGHFEKAFRGWEILGQLHTNQLGPRHELCPLIHACNSGGLSPSMMSLASKVLTANTPFPAYAVPESIIRLSLYHCLDRRDRGAFHMPSSFHQRYEECDFGESRRGRMGERASEKNGGGTSSLQSLAIPVCGFPSPVWWSVGH